MKFTKTFVLVFLAVFPFGYAQISATKNEAAFPTESKTKIIESSPTPPVKTDVKKNNKLESPVKIIGSFSKVISDGEHASGYDVELWRQGDKIFGLISAHRGLIGDPPTGILENVRYDSATKRLSFRAKLTLGIFFDKNNSNVPSRDIFEFQGIQTNKRLQGELKMINELCADKCPERKRINLPRSKEWSSMMSEYKTYAEWKAYADEILDFRGPRW